MLKKILVLRSQSYVEKDLDLRIATLNNYVEDDQHQPLSTDISSGLQLMEDGDTNLPPLPSAPRLSDLSSYQSRRTNNTLSSGLQQIEEDDNDLPLPMGAAEEISNTVEPPKQKIGKVEQLEDEDIGPELSAAMLEASLNAADPQIGNDNQL